MRYEFIVRDEDGNIVFAVDKPNIEMLEEEIGRWGRLQANKQENV